MSPAAQACGSNVGSYFIMLSISYSFDSLKVTYKTISFCNVTSDGQEDSMLGIEHVLAELGRQQL